MNRCDWRRASACALSFFFAGIPAMNAARADSLDKAIETVKSASDEDLRKEIERRLPKKKNSAATTRTIVATPRSAAPGLALLDDAQILTAARVTSRSIYGPDDRKDWYQVSAVSGLEPLARASVALFDAAKLEASSGGAVRIKAKSFQEVRHICTTPKEKFADQPSAAFCSGTLVRPDLVLTAGHCIREISGNEAVPEKVAGTKFVFGYLLQNATADATAVPAANVFAGKEVAGGESGDFADVHRHDWALVRLDRPVPAAIAETGHELGNRVHSQGPTGLRHGLPGWHAAQICTGRLGPGRLERRLVRCQPRYVRRQFRLRRVRPDDQEAGRRAGGGRNPTTSRTSPVAASSSTCARITAARARP